MAKAQSEGPETAPAARVRSKRRPVRVQIGPQEFVKKGLAPLDPYDPYFFAVSLGWRKFALLFLAAELAINLVFATLYCLQSGSIANAGSPRFLSAFFFSLETLATVGYGEMYPATTYAHAVSSLEILTGVIFTAIVTGVLFVRFSKPKARIQYASNPVVTRHNGQPTLMLRIGNARNNFLHDTTLELYVLQRQMSDEGQQHAAVSNIPLLRNRIPVFSILYTLMHVIDEASPLHGLMPDDGDLEGLRFFLTVAGRDPSVGQQITDIHTFEGADIRFGTRYADAVQSVGSRIIADYALLSATEPIPEEYRAPPK